MPASPGNGPLKPIGADGSLRPLLPTAFLAELGVGREEGEGERGVGEDGREGGVRRPVRRREGVRWEGDASPLQPQGILGKCTELFERG